MQAESYASYKYLPWKDPLGGSVDNDVANRSYPVNRYDIMTPETIQNFQSENDYG